uniref:NADH-ubiquinone oxidoreductase chain 6 n=1 Tax=Magnusiomyces ingens TaxID=44077 RepID=A0A023UM83_9ASCO|nr:NADH dehydrogenase subunit 6 [Magnusiomyces ingens]AHY04909.1 NADH dehydrogenase subunit 6 [Magnusiomyces ingens]QUX32919.1 NADH dehydrogenase subunit 6 [Magnusiomyces ingens]
MFMIELINTHLQMNNSLMMLFEYMSIMSALCVMFSRNAMVSMMYLMLLYVNMSMYLFYTGLGVMGLLYMLVYVGAMAMLFLFMLSLMNIKMSELSSKSNNSDMLLMIITLMTLSYVLMNINIDNINIINNVLSYINNMLQNDYSIDSSNINNIEMFNMLNINYDDLTSYSELKIIGELLYTEYSIVMLMIGLILLLTIIGVIIMTK